MYLTRGQPVVYYGDEQGFAGSGGDQDARQDMFASKTAQDNEEDVIAGVKGSRDRYDTSSLLYRSISQVAALRRANPAAPAVSFTSPRPGQVVGGRAEIAVSVPENVFAEVAFAYRRAGTGSWVTLGTDDNAPYRVFHDVSAIENGTRLEYRAVLRDSSGNVSATSTYGVVGQPG